MTFDAEPRRLQILVQTVRTQPTRQRDGDDPIRSDDYCEHAVVSRQPETPNREPRTANCELANRESVFH